MKKIFSILGLTLMVLGFSSTAKAAALIDLSLGTTIDYNTRTSVSDTDVSSDDSTSIKANTTLPKATSKSENATSSSVRSNSGISVITHNASDSLTEDDDIWIRNSARANGAATAQDHANENALENASANSALNFDASKVVSKDDLRAYASTTLKNDPSIDELRFKGREVQVGYKEHGKFLGLFKMPYTVHVVANADGTVSVKYPWYAFLFARDREAVDTEISTAVQGIVGNVSTTTGNVSLSASTAAEIVDAIRGILVSHFGTSTTATTTTSRY
jgi:hypothetical protein